MRVLAGLALAVVPVVAAGCYHHVAPHVTVTGPRTPQGAATSSDELMTGGQASTGSTSTTEEPLSQEIAEEIRSGQLKPVVAGSVDGNAWDVYVTDKEHEMGGGYGLEDMECLWVQQSTPSGVGGGGQCSPVRGPKAPMSFGGSGLGKGADFTVVAGVGGADATIPKTHASGGGLGKTLADGSRGRVLGRTSGVRNIPGVGRRTIFAEALPLDPTTGAAPRVTAGGEVIRGGG